LGEGRVIGKSESLARGNSVSYMRRLSSCARLD